MNTEINYSKKERYKVDIDFDLAEKAWRENKKYIGNGTFKYVCNGITKKGNKCNNKPTNSGYCHIHFRK
tara:strand:+ start:171 stop:377 length:207 start_codon:yes stop_codon:yes gene_type:complete